MKGEQKDLYDNFSDYTTSKYGDACVVKSIPQLVYLHSVVL